ncbi:hypothetical protein WBG99_15565 [Streptomyces sp. TG1A-60]|uniref:hypothetical protein n=1 Tax=Streptomyces sp. TG1A-60 TaxID=3129111 RepID=UPI0030D35699
MAGDTQDQDQDQGRIINNRYRLLRTLGAGGMGRVWLAYDEVLACEVFLKEISLPDVPGDATEPAMGFPPLERSREWGSTARARSEARHAARLRGHPHVATVHDVVPHEGLPWIVMEYAPDAIDLQAVVRQRWPLAPEQVARIGLAVLDALTRPRRRRPALRGPGRPDGRGPARRGGLRARSDEGGFTAAKGGTACLVLSKHVPIGGEVGRLRDAGVNLWPTQMAVGDCWDYTTRE